MRKKKTHKDYLAELFRKFEENKYPFPVSEEAEKLVLGSMILDENALIIATDIIGENEDVFYDNRHAVCYNAMRQLQIQGKKVDLVGLCDFLKERNEITEAGGYPYIVQLIENSVTSAYIENHANTILSLYIRREIILHEELMKMEAVISEKPVKQILAEGFERLQNLSELKRARKPVSIGEIFNNMLYTENFVNGVPTGFVDLDSLIDSWGNGNLITIAGRPGQGKSAFALNILSQSGKQKKRAAIFSLEMSNEELIKRLFCIESGVDFYRIDKPYISNDELQRLKNAKDVIESYNIYFDDSFFMTPLDLRIGCKKAQHKGGLDLVIIDYLQLVSPSVKGESREREVADITRELKALAKELNIPVIALAQLNREVERRTDKRPQLSDLRESGAVEQDSDLVLFLYRPESYDIDKFEDESSTRNKAELILAKNRHGKTGAVRFYFDGASSQFKNSSYQFA